MLRPAALFALAVLAALPRTAAADDDAMDGVTIVRPVPRGPGQHGFTIEVAPRPDPLASFSGIEVMRGGRLPAEASAPAEAPRPPVATAQAPASRRPLTIQIRPVRPVEIQPVAPMSRVSRTPSRAIQVERARSGLPPAALGDGDNDSLPFALPPGARTIRIR